MVVVNLYYWNLRIREPDQGFTVDRCRESRGKVKGFSPDFWVPPRVYLNQPKQNNDRARRDNLLAESVYTLVNQCRQITRLYRSFIHRVSKPQTLI